MSPPQLRVASIAFLGELRDAREQVLRHFAGDGGVELLFQRRIGRGPRIVGLLPRGVLLGTGRLFLGEVGARRSSPT